MKKHYNKKKKENNLWWKRYPHVRGFGITDFDRPFNIFQYMGMGNRIEVVQLIKRDQHKAKLNKLPPPKRIGFYEN